MRDDNIKKRNDEGMRGEKSQKKVYARRRRKVFVVSCSDAVYQIFVIFPHGF